MNSLSLREREVEAARSKLAADLAILSSPNTFAEFTHDLKADAINLKDEAVARAKSAVESTLQGFIEDMKARAAANPAAVLAIGAGIAWRLVRHPPIATALIGAGLYSLFKTDPAASRFPNNESFLSQARDRLREQVTDFASATKDQAEEFGETVADKTAELSSSMTESVSAMSQTAADKITEAASAATDRAKQWSDSAQTSIGELAQEAKAAVSGQQDSTAYSTQAARLSDLQQSRSPSLQPAQPSRDTLLLGAAGVAVVAAMGFALQRRMSEADENR